MPSLPSTPSRVPSGHGTKSSILYLHSPTVRPKDRVWLSGDPLIPDSLNCLTDITNELQALGATEITKHEIFKTLLRSLDSSFDTLALMIQECTDFKTLDPSDILERLNTHEFQLSEKRDIYGPNYGRTRALKAKVVSSSEENLTAVLKILKTLERSLLCL